MTTPIRLRNARARAALAAAVRAALGRLGYEEVETPSLVPAPGMEPHIDAFSAPFVPAAGGAPQPRWLISSPEYAMKRLLAEDPPHLGREPRALPGSLPPRHHPLNIARDRARRGRWHPRAR